MTAPLYVVVKIEDDIEDVQVMMQELSRANKVTLDVDGYRFTEASIERVGVVSP